MRAKISHQLPRLHGAEKDEEDGLPREGRRWGGSEISRDKGAIRLHSPLETPFTEEVTARKVAAPQRSHSGQTATSNPSAPGASHIPTHLSGPSWPSIQVHGVPWAGLGDEGGLSSQTREAGRTPGPRQTPPRPCFRFCKGHQLCSLKVTESGPPSTAHPSDHAGGRSFPCTSPALPTKPECLEFCRNSHSGPPTLGPQ